MKCNEKAMSMQMKRQWKEMSGLKAIGNGIMP